MRKPTFFNGFNDPTALNKIKQIAWLKEHQGFAMNTN